MSIIEELRRRIATEVKNGTSQNAIASASGVDKATLSKFRNGHRGISAATIDRLADYLGVRLK
jgi:transcriptional regulator with XRE-family HTH domain